MVPTNESRKHYNNALKSFNSGKEKQTQFFIQRILKSDHDDLELIISTMDLILKMEYDDWGEDVDICLKRIIALKPNDESNWTRRIKFLYEDMECNDEVVDILNNAIKKFPKSEQFLKMKCNILSKWEEDGLEILKTCKMLKDLNPNHKSIPEIKEAAIDIIMMNEEDDNPEVLDLIDKI